MTPPADWVIFCSGSPWEVAAHRQHALAREVARDRNVLFLDPPGHALRRRLEVTPVGERLWHARPIVAAPGGRVIPAANRINRAATAAAVQRWLSGRGDRRVLWLDEDLAAAMVGRCGESLVVYDATDLDWTFTRTWNRRHLKRCLARAVASADLVMASSPALPALLPAGKSQPVVVANACDAERFRPDGPVSPLLAGLPRPIIGYLGSVDTRALDGSLVSEVARSRPDCTFVLVGPATEQGRASVGGADNIVVLPAVPYDEAASLVRGCDAGIIPYRIGGLIDYVQPKKLYEYLAAGKPVVSTPLPSLRAIPGALWLAPDAASFSAAVGAALACGGPERAAARTRIAAQNSWSVRGDAVRELLDGLAGRAAREVAA